MARHRETPTVNAHEPPTSVRPAAQALADWSGKPPGKRAEGISNASSDRAKAEIDLLMRTGDWSNAKPLHFVVLYQHLHMRVYGAEALMTNVERSKAAMRAGSALKSYFDGDRNAMADFVRWTWVREKGRETWRRDNKQGGGRIGVNLQFSATLVSDYRVDQARKAGQ